MATEDEEWEPLTEVDMKLLQARRERSDQISKRMGDYLLKGYKMLATTCPKCDVSTILFVDVQGVFFFFTISFSCHFYMNKDINMRSFVTCCGHWVILFDMQYMMVYLISNERNQHSKCSNIILIPLEYTHFDSLRLCD